MTSLAKTTEYLQKLRKKEQSYGKGRDAKRVRQLRMKAGLSALGMKDWNAAAVPLVSVWDGICQLVGKGGWDPEDLTELSLAVFPPILHRIILYWVDATIEEDTLMADLTNAFSTQFTTRPPAFLCGTAPLITSLLPFDSTLWAYDSWFSTNAKTLATYMEISTPGWTAPDTYKTRPRMWTSFYCKPCLPSGLFVYTKRRMIFDGEEATYDTAKNLLSRPEGTRKEKFQPEPVVPVEHFAYSGVSCVYDIEAQILEYLTPRDLRSAEKTCRTWAKIVALNPDLSRLLHLGAFVRNRFIRFFDESWGDEHFNLVTLLIARSRFLTLWKSKVPSLHP
eukprot:TRINITY_DN20672_c0_g1_i1.p1 TRINITY_DN20672_c0_g1~~TRINITY_DN20672_c0_g1_i1.p1  ORF type:complete len:335 (+),score=33.38 TRINITY_DN20672_c0_g1_i1:81-1085(+)